MAIGTKVSKEILVKLPAQTSNVLFFSNYFTGDWVEGKRHGNGVYQYKEDGGR